jgi:hypothetical protein
MKLYYFLFYYLFSTFLFIACKNSSNNHKEDSNIYPPIESDTPQSISKLMPPANNSTSEMNYVEIKDFKIIYDSDFKPYLSTNIQNNLKEAIIAFEIILIPTNNFGKDCPSIKFTKQKKILPGKIISIKEPIYFESKDLCNLNHPKIELGEFILNSGEKTSVQMLWWKSISKPVKE